MNEQVRKVSLMHLAASLSAVRSPMTVVRRITQLYENSLRKPLSYLIQEMGKKPEIQSLKGLELKNWIASKVGNTLNKHLDVTDSGIHLVLDNSKDTAMGTWKRSSNVFVLNPTNVLANVLHEVTYDSNTDKMITSSYHKLEEILRMFIAHELEHTTQEADQSKGINSPGEVGALAEEIREGLQWAQEKGKVNYVPPAVAHYKEMGGDPNLLIEALKKKGVNSVEITKALTE
jgi:hypothetical protein